MFVKITNGEVAHYPYAVGDLRRDNPNVSFPKTISNSVFARYGVYPVGYEGAPEYDSLTHYLQHSNVPALVGGNWVLTKTVVALTTEQIAEKTAAKAREVRADRDTLLVGADWTQVADAPVNATDWATYRQALRDITDHANWPYLEDSDWPTKP